jgi:hypothetical protein
MSNGVVSCSVFHNHKPTIFSSPPHPPNERQALAKCPVIPCFLNLGYQKGEDRVEFASLDNSIHVLWAHVVRANQSLGSSLLSRLLVLKVGLLGRRGYNIGLVF